jgi:hypothetical protein
MGGSELWGQSQTGQAQAPASADGAAAVQAPAPTTDRFPEQRAEADRLRVTFSAQDAATMADIDAQIERRRCQIDHIDGQLTRLKELMNGWLDAERLYWKGWNEAETRRVDIEQKSLVNIEAEQTSAAQLVDTDKKDREELLRRRAALSQGSQTDAVRTQMDALAADLQDMDARLADAQSKYDAATQKLNNSQASLTTRLVRIRENLNNLDSYKVTRDAQFETKRTTAQEICDNKAPDSKQTDASHGKQ